MHLAPIRIFLFLLGGLLIFRGQVQATHIKAADLYATINPFNSHDTNAHRIVRFTLTVYCKASSVDASGTDPHTCGARLGNCVKLDYGDGTSSDDTPYSSIKGFDNDTYQFIYYFDHTFPTDNFYKISYYDENRNNNIQNLQSPSNTIPFYIEMGMNIENGLGVNQTPQMTIAPIYNGEEYRIFKHNPGAYDPNGDSISYFSYYPQFASGFKAPGYQDPNLPFQGTTQDGLHPATYAVDPILGNVIWDSPAKEGLYNVAFVIEEWRTIGNTKVRLSYTIRDMQINVLQGTNHPPVITVPKDVCIQANSLYKGAISVSDPDHDKVNLSLNGELAQMTPNAVTFTPKVTNPVSTVFTTQFNWQPQCKDVRKRPYQAFFIATDLLAANSNSPTLTDIESFFIYVVGPQPSQPTLPIVSKDSIVLQWKNYTKTACTLTNGAYKMQIYRRVGCDTTKLSNCQTGAPDGYVLIGQVSIADTVFVDKTIKRGNVYSYRIVASFIDEVNLLSYSYPSNNTCVSLPLIAPIITKVSFIGKAKDSLSIAWDKPVQLDTTKTKGPYTYSVYRKKTTEASYILLDTISLLTLADSSFIDAHIDSATTYTYLVSLKYRDKDSLAILTDSSESASSVLLTTASVGHGISLSWTAQTPWSNSVDTSFHHFVWRKRASDRDFVLIGMPTFNQNTTTYTFTDLGTPTDPLKEKEEIAYFVTTAGSYKNSLISPPRLYNNSFISKNIVLDITPPCPPILDQIVYDCSKFNQTAPYYNLLTWTNPPYSAQCDSDIVSYKLYYSPKRTQDAMPLLKQLTDTTYKHPNLATVAGCYTVTALDGTGNESAKSNLVCVEACKQYELPNVFTPNNSGGNDLFRPLPPSPLSVESVEFKVFNRWGQKVFEKNDDINLNWDGAGLPDGVYFYQAKVHFVSVEADDTKELKGWVQILR
jgi:gliding motility-associated-like protein